jgi:hypothetical protein
MTNHNSVGKSTSTASEIKLIRFNALVVEGLGEVVNESRKVTRFLYAKQKL